MQDAISESDAASVKSEEFASFDVPLAEQQLRSRIIELEAQANSHLRSLQKEFEVEERELPRLETRCRSAPHKRPHTPATRPRASEHSSIPFCWWP